ncbi:RDD family protein [Gulosibacter sp. 10]|uniref:RDD family protein n=1 Tax=Gulosibacter sp. 10 TaxID=1255570 RepID=UPI00097F081C|nr:RDD family protein [Gulosibacter sp. 10]SJM54330.1 POSSIBLE CONSERVED MEMBRANE PROTEIN [Gulosibacter sp. 10]
MSTSTTASSISFDEDDIVIGEGVALGVPSAGFLSRAGGAAIDLAVTLLLYILSLFALGWLLTNWMYFTGSTISEAWLPVLQVSWTVLWFIFVPVTVETLSHGRSLGKLIFGVRVVRDDGGAIGFRHAFVRALLGLFEVFITFGSVAILVGLLNPRAKRFGDMLAGTYAQLERVRRPVPLDLRLPPVLQGWAAVADVSKLPDPVARRMHDFFLQAERLDPRARQQLAGVLARQARPHVHPIPDVDAETFVLGVAVLRREREYQGIERRRTRVERIAQSTQALPHGFPYRG